MRVSRPEAVQYTLSTTARVTSEEHRNSGIEHKSQLTVIFCLIKMGVSLPVTKPDIIAPGNRE